MNRHRDAAFLGWDQRTTAAGGGPAAGGGGGRQLDDHRIFVAGLSDEAGLATPLALAVKQLGSPSDDEIEWRFGARANSHWAILE